MDDLVIVVCYECLNVLFQRGLRGQINQCGPTVAASFPNSVHPLLEWCAIASEFVRCVLSDTRYAFERFQKLFVVSD